MKVATEKWNIPKLLEPEEMIENPDELSSFTYVAFFLKGIHFLSSFLELGCCILSLFFSSYLLVAGWEPNSVIFDQAEVKRAFVRSESMRGVALEIPQNDLVAVGSPVPPAPPPSSSPPHPPLLHSRILF